MYRGIITPLVTPFDEHDAVDQRGVAALVESIRPHVDGLMPALSSGEGWKLDEQQWHDMVGGTREVAGNLPVLAGIQLPTTSEVVRRAKSAEALGVDAIVVTTPFRAGISQQEIEEHYREVRAASDLPIFLYNEEALSGNRIALDTLTRICRTIPGIVGIKESSGSAEFTQQLVAADLGIPVFEGWENLLLAVGPVAGFVGPLANLEPELCSRMLTDPTPALQDEINQACRRYGLFEDDWYLGAKRELRSRGIIATDRVVAGGERP